MYVHIYIIQPKGVGNKSVSTVSQNVTIQSSRSCVILIKAG